MNVTVRDLLTEHYNSQPQDDTSELVFRSPRTGGRLVDIKRSFTLACEDAGIYKFRFHHLRQTAATRFADTGADAFTIAEIPGHASLAMTKRYMHATDAAKPRGVERVAERMAETANNGTVGKDCLKFVTNEKWQTG